MDSSKHKIVEAFTEMNLNTEFVEINELVEDDGLDLKPIKQVDSNPKIVYEEPFTGITINGEDKVQVNGEECNSTKRVSLDINYNHLTDQQPSEPENSETQNFDRHRRRSSRLTNLKSDLIESGAIFRPPFTPSNSLAKAPSSWISPRGSIVEPTVYNTRSTTQMRSTSVRPGSRASSGVSGSRAPSLPPVPKNKRYSHIQSRTVSHTDHKRPESQVRITHKPVKIEAKSKVGSLANIDHVARGGDKKIPTQKLKFDPKPRIGSLANIQHIAGGGQNKIASQKLDFKEKAQPRIESHMDIQKLQMNGKESGRSNLHTSSSDVFPNGKTSK